MSKPSNIDADYLGVCICLNPGNVVYAVDIISLSFTHLLSLKIQSPHVWSSVFRCEELNFSFLLFRVSVEP